MPPDLTLAQNFELKEDLIGHLDQLHGFYEDRAQGSSVLQNLPQGQDKYVHSQVLKGGFDGSNGVCYNR